MARKRPRGSVYASSVTSGFTLSDLIKPLPSLPINNFVRSPLTAVEDNRTWDPDPDPLSRQTRRWTSPTQLAPRPKPTRSGRLFDVQALNFKYPKFVVRCVRRKIRNEVLHALGKTGKGSGRRLKNRKYNRNQLSNVRC